MHLPSTTTRRVALATVVWGVVFAIVHVYWAAAEPSLAAGLYIAFIAILGLAGAAVAYGFLAGHRDGRLLLLARLGAAALLLGVVFGTARWIADGSLGGRRRRGRRHHRVLPARRRALRAPRPAVPPRPGISRAGGVVCPLRARVA